MRRFQFSNDEYDKLSAVTGFTPFDLQKLDAIGLLSNDVHRKQPVPIGGINLINIYV